MSKSILSYCTDLSRRLPRNTPKEDDWVEAELHSNEQSRILRVVDSVEFARRELSARFESCIKNSQTLASEIMTSPTRESALWARLLGVFISYDVTESQATRAGVLRTERDRNTLLVFMALQRTILDEVILPLLERR
jgi:hypothetical protein